MVADSRFCMWQGLAPSGAKADPLNTPAELDFHAGKMPHVTRLQRNDAGELVRVQPACFSQQPGASDPKPTAMTSPKQPEPKPADAYRQQADQIVKAFGEVRGKEYVAKGMTYGEALQDEFAAAKAENAKLTADAGKRERKTTGFASKLKIVKTGGVFNAFGSKHTQRSE